MRRGAASANAAYGNSTAILVGDLLFGKASELVADLGAEAVKIQAQTFVRLCSGQIRDDRPCPDGVDPVDYYLGVLADKTGVLIATAARYGAMFGGGDDADRRDHARLRRAGSASPSSSPTTSSTSRPTPTRPARPPAPTCARAVDTLPCCTCHGVRPTRPTRACSSCSPATSTDDDAARRGARPAAGAPRARAGPRGHVCRRPRGAGRARPAARQRRQGRPAGPRHWRSSTASADQPKAHSTAPQSKEQFVGTAPIRPNRKSSSSAGRPPQQSKEQFVAPPRGRAGPLDGDELLFRLREGQLRGMGSALSNWAVGCDPCLAACLRPLPRACPRDARPSRAARRRRPRRLRRQRRHPRRPGARAADPHRDEVGAQPAPHRAGAGVATASRGSCATPCPRLCGGRGRGTTTSWSPTPASTCRPLTRARRRRPGADRRGRRHGRQRRARRLHRPRRRGATRACASRSTSTRRSASGPPTSGCAARRRAPRSRSRPSSAAPRSAASSSRA